MIKHSLPELINKLKSSSQVKGVFMTGSSAQQLLPSSDIDLVIILEENSANIRSIYTEVEKHFADIFFFDLPFIKGLVSAIEVKANDLPGMFITWLGQGRIEYDPSGLLQKLQAQISQQSIAQTITETEKLDAWVKANYSLIANKRYFASEQNVYHKALEVRLLYSVTELLTTYFVLREIPWRGEKKAVEYLADQDSNYWALFEKFLRSTEVQEKMEAYLALFRQTLNSQYPEWSNDFNIPIDTQGHYNTNLKAFWNIILGKEKSE